MLFDANLPDNKKNRALSFMVPTGSMFPAKCLLAGLPKTVASAADWRLVRFSHALVTLFVAQRHVSRMSKAGNDSAAKTIAIRN